MNTDSFYTKGSTHRENQDYATHGVKDGHPYAIISDGCSSAPRSDFGARLLVQSALQYLGEAGYNDLSFSHSVAMTARIFSNNLGLDDDSLCATLLATTVVEDYFNVFISGDGIVVAKYFDRMEATEYRFNRGAPAYLRYSLDPQMAKDYWAKFGPDVTQRTYVIDGVGNVIYKEETTKYPSAPFFFKKKYPLVETEWVAVISDGGGSFIEIVDSVTGLEPQELSVPIVLSNMLNFKNFQGEFVQRRLVKAFKEFAKKGWQNTDDVSVAVIVKE